MRYNREAEKEARKESLRQAGYRDDLTGPEKLEALKKAEEIFQEYLDECAEIEQEEEEYHRISDIRYSRKSRKEAA